MQKKKNRDVVLQWVLPTLALLIAIISIIADFSEKSRKVLENIMKDDVAVVGECYATCVSQMLGNVIHSTEVAASLVEMCGVTDRAGLLSAVEKLKDANNIYETAYCYLNGDAVFAGNNLVSLREAEYFEKVQSGQPFLTYTGAVGLSNQEALLYAYPIEIQGKVKGQILVYFAADMLEQIFNEQYKNMGFYSIVDAEGNVLVSCSNQESKFLEGNFWDMLRDTEKNLSGYVLFDRQLKAGEKAVLSVRKEDEERLICAYPIADTDWYFVMGIDEAFIDGVESLAWAAVYKLLIKLGGMLLVYLLAVFAIGVLMKRRTTELHKELEDKADTDLLTDLNNKMATERKIKEYMEGHPDRQAVMFILDVDNFKKINDTLGHAFGDEVLRNLGMRLQSMFRVTDIIGRTGGDEFIIFLKDVQREEAILKESRKIEQFFHQFEVGQYVKYSITASIGGAVFPKDGKTFEDLYKSADNALYTSKRNGKNQLSFYHEEKNKDL